MKKQQGASVDAIRNINRTIRTEQLMRCLRKIRSFGQNPASRALLMTALGILNAVGSAYYQPVIYRSVGIETGDQDALTWKTATVSQIPVKTATVAASETETAVPARQPVLGEFNLVHTFPAGADETDPAQSLGNQVFSEMIDWDSDWAGAVYGYSSLTPAEMTEKMGISKACIMGDYNPEDSAQEMDDPSTWTIDRFRNVWFLVEDGDGNAIQAYSNVQEIMAMASVYTYYHDPDDAEAFFSYCKALWKASHYYTLTISDVYHCSGCVRADGSRLPEASDANAGTAAADASAEGSLTGSMVNKEAETTPYVLQLEAPTYAAASEAIGNEGSPAASENAAVILETTAAEPETAETAASENRAGSETAAVSDPAAVSLGNGSEELICPGHVDLTIVLRIAGLDEEKGLFARDPMGRLERSTDPEGWQGWTEENQAAARLLALKDWSAEYGVHAAVYTAQFPLQTVDVDAYLLSLPADLSEERKNLLRFALGSVGRVPYHWGGKAAAMGYEGNNFGTAVTPDSEGRSQKGLDCSGWISWVYWSATGKRLGAESTSSLAGIGTRIRPEQLKPGDILVRTGSNAHTVMFLGWSTDGRIVCVHETSGSVNNVTISVRDADWPYYIRILD